MLAIVQMCTAKFERVPEPRTGPLTCSWWLFRRDCLQCVVISSMGVLNVTRRCLELQVGIWIGCHFWGAGACRDYWEGRVFPWVVHVALLAEAPPLGSTEPSVSTKT